MQLFSPSRSSLSEFWLRVISSIYCHWWCCDILKYNCVKTDPDSSQKCQVVSLFFCVWCGDELASFILLNLHNTYLLFFQENMQSIIFWRFTWLLSWFFWRINIKLLFTTCECVHMQQLCEIIIFSKFYEKVGFEKITL